MSNLEAAVKAASEALGLLDFDQQREQFNSTAQEIGKLRAEYERLENAGKSEQLVGYIAELSRQLSAGEIPNSLNNIKSLVEALENRVLYIDIESPELPATIEKLILAKQSADNLDGKKATIINLNVNSNMSTVQAMKSMSSARSANTNTTKRPTTATTASP